MDIEQLLADLRAFADGKHESSGYLLTVEQSRMLAREIDLLRADVVFLRSLVGRADGRPSFREITKDARREVPVNDTSPE